MFLSESHVEAAGIEWIQKLGYALVHGSEIAPGEPAAERESFADVVLARQLLGSIERLNWRVPTEAQEETRQKVLCVESPSIIASNREFHAIEGDWTDLQRCNGSYV